MPMPRPKSILKKSEFTIAKASHNCKNNSKHRINMGDKRLTITEGRNRNHYCKECAILFLEKDMENLEKLINEVKE